MYRFAAMISFNKLSSSTHMLVSDIPEEVWLFWLGKVLNASYPRLPIWLLLRSSISSSLRNCIAGMNVSLLFCRWMNLTELLKASNAEASTDINSLFCRYLKYIVCYQMNICLHQKFSWKWDTYMLFHGNFYILPVLRPHILPWLC